MLCHLKELDRVLLVVDCRVRMHWKQVAEHPAVQLLQKCSG